MNKAFERMTKYVFEKIYDEGTSLIYDQRTTLEPDGHIKDLPTPEHIAVQTPNPCSWGTGMENSMICAGLMLEGVVRAYSVSGNERLKEYAQKLLRGIELCSTVSGKRGFLARSVSPVDRKSYYINTSRDQYTHVIFGMIKYLNSPMCDEEDGALIRGLLNDYASLAKKEVTEENGYGILRADGRIGVVCNMMKVMPHEILRLPMFYLAAYEATRDKTWLDCYMAVRDECLICAEKGNSAGNFQILIQTQQSAVLLYELEHDAEYKKRYLSIIKENAEAASSYMPRELLTMDLNVLGVPWHERSFEFKWGITVLNGYAYYIPSEKQYEQLLPLYCLGSAIAVQALCPNHIIPNEQLELFKRVCLNMDMEKHASHAPVYLANASSFFVS